MKVINSHAEMNPKRISVLNHRLDLSSFADLHTLEKNVLQSWKTN